MSRLPTLLLPGQMDLFLLVAQPVSEVPLSTIPGRRARHEPKGRVYNLAAHFDTINRVIFGGRLEPPTLRWSRNRWTHTLGLCDVKKRVITLNISLDDARVPDVVIAAVMHHEMLHLHFGVSEGRDGSRRFHTPQFRIAERAFPGYLASERWLSSDWPLRGRPATRPRENGPNYLAYLKTLDPLPPPVVHKSPDPALLAILEFPAR